MHFNQRGNFMVLWEPAGAKFGRPGPNCDWSHWYCTDAYAGSRPTNELLWLRDLREVENMFRVYTGPPRPDDDLPVILRTPELTRYAKQVRREYQQQDRIVDSILLQAATALVRQLKSRLEPHFDITWHSDIFATWEEVKDPSAPLGRRHRLRSWDIDSVRERTAQAERTELKSLRKEVGCTSEQLMDAYVEVHGRGQCDDYSNADRVTRLLKRRGHKMARASLVRRWLELLRKHEPARFPKPPPSPMPENVLPFKRD